MRLFFVKAFGYLLLKYVRHKSRARHRLAKASVRTEELEQRLVLSTVQNFDDPGTAFVSAQFGSLPGPTVHAGGPTGNFETLATTNVISINSITAPVTDAGAFGEIEAVFDFRITPGNGQADGFGFDLLNTADHEYGTAASVGGYSEEPNYRKSLGFGFDIYQNQGEISDNHLSIHFDESKLLEVDLTPFGVELASGQFIRARIVAHPGSTAGGGDVTVALTPSGGQPITVLDHYIVSGLLPYESRVHFMARSGGQSATHDLDNIFVDFRNPVAGTISLVSANYTVVEAQPQVLLTVVRTGGSQNAATVTYSTLNGTATSGSDFMGVTGSILTFAAGEVTKTIGIPIINDSTPEVDESFQVTISDPSVGATLGTISSATVSILDVDDDSPEQVGEWGEVTPLPVVAIHQVLLPTGKILFWSRHSETSDGMPHLYDPVTGEINDTPELDYDIFCAGHTLLPDGRVLVAGGHIADGVGEKKASIYDPFTNTWSPVADMNAGRWYPTLTVLPSGEVLVMGGTTTGYNQTNTLSQVFQPTTGTWRDLTDALLGDYPDWPDFYPWVSIAPNGLVFVAGPEKTARYLDTNGTGAWIDVGDSSLNYRDYGSSVAYADGKVLIVGGAEREDGSLPEVNLPSASTEVIDLNGPTPTWRAVSPMSTGRRHLNTTVLPDGTVLATGGSSAPGFQDPAGAVLYAELWNPITEDWTPMANYSNFQGYHSNALLLPTGQVLMTGGGQPAPPNGSDQKNAQIYSPPFLFAGQRPTIVSEPPTVRYGQSFVIGTPDSNDIATVSLIPLGSPTHAFNENQRFSSLSFVSDAGALSVEAPSGPNLAPPGYYMLFIINAAGAPSMAQIVQVVDELSPIVTLSVTPASLTEAADTATITATLSVPTSFAVTVNLTFNGTATIGTDYTTTTAQILIPAGETTGTSTITTVQDNLDETSETILINIDGVINAVEDGTQRVTATITDNNNSPVFTSSATPVVPENRSAVLTVVATDNDLPAQTVTYSLTGGEDQAKFAITTQGMLTFVAEPDFESPTDSNRDNIYWVEVTASDGAGGTTVQNLSVTVTAINDNTPVFTSDSVLSVPENTTAVLTVTSTDADLPAQNVTFSLTGGVDHGRFAITAQGALTFVTAPDFENPTDTGLNNVYNLQVTASDGEGRAAVQNITITVTPLNDNAPTFVTPPIFSTAENATAVTTIVAIDADLPQQIVTYSISGGPDQNKFSITNTGELRFLIPPDFENPTDAGANNVYDVQIMANDGSGRAAVQNVSVAVGEVNDNPLVFSSPALFNVPENIPIVGKVVATDADLPVRAVSYSITGGPDQAKFAITVQGELIFDTAPDFEDPIDANGDNVYLVQVTANDGNGELTVQAITVAVTALNDHAPDFSSLSTFIVQENTAVVGAVIATDEDLPAQLISYAISGGPDQNKFSITNTGELRFVSPPDFENPTDVGANNVYNVQVTASDGSGEFTIQNLTVIVTSVNDNAPVFVSATEFNLAENSNVVGIVRATDSDLPAQTISYAITGGVDAAQFLISSTGTLTFVTGPDFEGPTDAGNDNVYNVDITANDGNGRITVQSFSVNVIPVNDHAPQFASSTSINVPENTAALLTVVAIDADSPTQTVTYTLTGGEDLAKFAITVQGELTFLAAPDFEDSTDANGDNIYLVDITANDGAGGTAMQTLSVTVTAINDNGPNFTSNSNVSVLENTTAILNVTATDADAPAQNVQFALTGGLDQAKFAITPQGILTFVAAPDFENPTDTALNNVYNLQVTANDESGRETVQNLTVTVLGLNEPPTDISLSGVSVVENNTAGISIGLLDATDSDLNNIFSFSLAAGTGDADNDSFAIVGSKLQLNVAANFETQTSYTVRLRVTDQGGLSIEKSFTVTVIDVNESPSILAGQTFSIAENAESNTQVGTVVATDTDFGDSITYSIVSGNASGTFSIDPESGIIKVAHSLAVDFEATPIVVLGVEVADSRGLTKTANVVISLLDANEVVNGAPGVTWIRKQAPVTVFPEIGVNGTTNLRSAILTITVSTIGSRRKFLDQISFPPTNGLGTSVGPQVANGILNLQVQLGNNTSSESVQSFLRGITFATKGKGLKTARRTMVVTLTDTSMFSATVSQTIDVRRKPL